MNTERVIDNRTPLAARAFVADDRHGREVLVVVAKIAWQVSAEGAARMVVPGVEVRGGAEHEQGYDSSERYPSDLEVEKPGTDVLLVGTAQPPAEGDASEHDVSLKVVGDSQLLHKTLRVYGPRVWYRAVMRVAPGSAGKVAATPLRWENTYGGRDEGALFEERNPVGSGFAADRGKLVGQAVAPIEDPAAPFGSGKPAPAGFGPIASHWQPRAGRAGSYDADWRKQRAPLKPLDYDPRFACCASDDQWFEQPLAGDEAVEVSGATAEGVWRFRLPRYAPAFVCSVRGEERELATHLDTYHIDADRRVVELTWRARVPMPHKSEHIEWLRIRETSELPEDVWQQLRADVRAHARDSDAEEARRAEEAELEQAMHEETL